MAELTGEARAQWCRAEALAYLRRRGGSGREHVAAGIGVPDAEALTALQGLQGHGLAEKKGSLWLAVGV